MNYDSANWLALASVLATALDHIHPLNREQIICDVAALANTGHVSFPCPSLACPCRLA